MEEYCIQNCLLLIGNVKRHNTLKNNHFKTCSIFRKHFYLGSANLSDRGLTKTKEMGVLVTNCPTLAEDAAILFDVYWELGGRNKLIKE